MPPCNVSSGHAHSSLGPRPWCGDQAPTTPKCDLTCYNTKYEKPYLDDIFKGKFHRSKTIFFHRDAIVFLFFLIVFITASKVYSFSGCTARKALRKHGPYVAMMRVYEDFLTYKSGKYIEHE